jgi:hypothetical protein
MHHTFSTNSRIARMCRKAAIQTKLTTEQTNKQKKTLVSIETVTSWISVHFIYRMRL